MIFKHFNWQKRNFLNFLNFIRIHPKIIAKFSVNFHIFILITENFQTFLPKIGFSFYIEDIFQIVLFFINTITQKVHNYYILFL